MADICTLSRSDWYGLAKLNILTSLVESCSHLKYESVAYPVLSCMEKARSVLTEMAVGPLALIAACTADSCPSSRKVIVSSMSEKSLTYE